MKRHDIFCAGVSILIVVLFLRCSGQAQGLEFRRIAEYQDSFANVFVADDLNHDGIPDVAIAKNIGAGLYAVSTLLGRGDGTLSRFTDFPIGGFPTSMAAGDFNHDGNLDVVTATEADSGFGNNGLSVLLGNGDGTFQPEVEYPCSGNSVLAVAVADFNGDGNPDIIASTGKSLNLFLGNGDGTFQDPIGFRPNGLSYFLAVSDVNSDGRQDLLATYPAANTVGVMIGNGDGTFQPQTRYQTQAAPAQVVTGDLNGDGNPDLVVAVSGDGKWAGVSVLLGNGDGTFQPQEQYPTGEDPLFLAVGDFSGDGDLDVAVTNYYGQSFTVLFGTGDGTLRHHAPYFTSINPGHIATADLNGDGALDILVLDPAFLEVWLNTKHSETSRQFTHQLASPASRTGAVRH